MTTWASLPLLSSFCSMEETIRHEARRAPMTFLYATESRLRSSTVSSWSVEATRFMFSTISVEHNAYISWTADGNDEHTRTIVSLSLLSELGKVDGVFTSFGRHLRRQKR